MQSGKNVSIFQLYVRWQSNLSVHECKVRERSTFWAYSSSVFIGPANQNVTTMKNKIQNFNWILSFQTRKENLNLIEA